MSDKSKLDIEVGQTLHRLRGERGLTVASLAQSAAVSQAMISRIENGQVSPSLSTLAALAQALSVPVMALVAQVDQVADVHHVKAGQGLTSRRVTANETHNYHLLGKHSGPGGSFQAARVRLTAAETESFPVYQHEGHVFLQILSGQAVYRCGEALFQLESGDTLTFDAKLPHGMTRIKGDVVEFITVSSRPD